MNLSLEAQKKLKSYCNAPENAVCDIFRKSAYIIEISVKVGNGIYGKFKFDCKKGSYIKVL